ncbi:MAG TPA: xanthine dehydrogenase family protein molybdopterin-binding subunit [Candidatus Caldiarchaeum subterraneum]|uniref:Xanthine dehydrogenase family protein molybdopterin-binding subunit n=1 Tax=Caldiarchaeum subterraneum TaxID=311458 RepID=A0A833EBB3_CALS0|nr:xanthine dehydrogenase family protein molybdopterin-binding subunit [Candidatus Caldarchaeum subterraneum]
MMQTQYVGSPVKRKEDPRLIKGESTYLDDIKLPGMLYAAFLRSSYPHAKIKRIDVSQALTLEGVVAVYTGKDLKDAVGPLVVESINRGSKVPSHYPLAVDEVKFVGEPVAVVVAEDRYVAKDALERIIVEYEPLPAVVDPEKALEDEAPKVHEDYEDNVCFRWKKAFGDVEQSFSNADEVIEARFRIQRLAPTAMEPRGVVAHYDALNRILTIWSSTQFPHKLRTWVATSLNWPENRIRVITPEVGGGFGSKLNHYPEEVVIPYLAVKLGRPVKWFEERRENLQATTHGRDMIAYVKAAVKRDGKILGLKVRLIADLGAYNYVYTQDNPLVAARMIPGCYKLESIELDVVGVFTNKIATDAYRGAGRPEASYIIERTVDRIARKLGIDPAEIRRRNFIQPSEFPYKTVTKFVYDTGNYEAALNKALELLKYSEVRAEQERLRGEGRYIGVGLSSFVEVCNFSYQSASVRVEPTGKVLVFTSTSPHGQGEETAFAQIVADVFGVDMDSVQVIHGDTLAIPYGWGTAGSWTLTSGGNAILKACKEIREKMLKIAAAKLEARPEDLEMREGRIFVKDAPDKSLSFEEVAGIAYDPESIPEGMEIGLATTSFYVPNLTFPFGAYAAVVEVFPESGEVKLLKLVLVNDVGKVVNPMLVEGQVHGGAAQAIGQAIYEEIAYTEDGVLLTDTLSEYLIPTAVEIPWMITDRTETPAPNPLGTKGVGEMGAIGLAQAIVNAVEDALTPFDVKIEDTPVTPAYLWKLVNAEKKE